jgi:hypothetical protein
MRSSLVVAVIICVVVVALEGCAATVSTVPLPADAMVVPPDVDVPLEIAAYSGTWEGEWNNMMARLPHTLVVEKIEKDGSASVIYAQGECLAWNVKPAFARAQGIFKNGALVVKLPRATATYQMQPDGKITAKFEGPGISFLRAVMSKTAGVTQVESAKQ